MEVTREEGDARSELSGAVSSRSSGSRKYRVVSRESNVDETLFGSSKSASNIDGGRKSIMPRKRISFEDVSHCGISNSE